MVLKFEQVRHLLRTRGGPACTGVVDTLRCTSPLTPPAHSRCGKFHTFSLFFLTLPYQRHVDTGTEGDGRHGVQHVDVQLGEDEGALEPGAHRLHAGVGVDRNIGHDVPGQ